MVPELDRIDWSQPWYAAIERSGATLEGGVELHTQLNRALINPLVTGLDHTGRPHVGSGKPILFAPGEDAPHGVAYETHIFATGRIPTRDNLHDALNALTWLAFPRTKARLNALHAAALEGQRMQGGVGKGRGAVRDAATLLDENGMLWACSDESLAIHLRRFDWTSLFIARRADFMLNVEPWVIGHALMEKLGRPYKGITAHALIVPVEPQYFAMKREERLALVDALADAWLDNISLSTVDLCPVPVLGIPGWWAPNADPRFYDDPQVFRTGRRARSRSSADR